MRCRAMQGAQAWVGAPQGSRPAHLSCMCMVAPTPTPSRPFCPARGGGGGAATASLRAAGVDALAVALMANMHSTTRLSRQRAQPWGCPGGKA